MVAVVQEVLEGTTKPWVAAVAERRRATESFMVERFFVCCVSATFKLHGGTRTRLIAVRLGCPTGAHGPTDPRVHLASDQPNAMGIKKAPYIDSNPTSIVF